MPNYMEKMGQYLDQMRETDGHIYQLAGLNECYHCQYARKMWVNTHLLHVVWHICLNQIIQRNQDAFLNAPLCCVWCIVHDNVWIGICVELHGEDGPVS